MHGRWSCFTSITAFIVAALLTGCGGKKREADTQAEAAPSDSQRIESLSQALSRAQARIEELDAKVTSMSDKLESTKLTVDNITNSKEPVTTHLVGSADGADAEALEPKGKPRAKIKPVAVAAVSNKAAVNQDDTTMEFRKGMALFKAGKYSDAELIFDKITESAPEHVLAGSAQFYAGESYYRMREYKLAQAEFEKVLGTYGTSPRAASAMVRIAHCQAALGNEKESANTLSRAQDLFPGNPSLDWLAQSGAPKTGLDTGPMGQPEPEASHGGDHSH